MVSLQSEQRTLSSWDLQRLKQGHLLSHPWRIPGNPCPSPNPLCSLLIFSVEATKSKDQGVRKAFGQQLMQVWGGGGKGSSLGELLQLPGGLVGLCHAPGTVRPPSTNTTQRENAEEPGAGSEKKKPCSSYTKASSQ